MQLSDFKLTVGVDHVDDGDGEVHPDGEAERVAQEAHEGEGVSRAPWRCSECRWTVGLDSFDSSYLNSPFGLPISSIVARLLLRERWRCPFSIFRESGLTNKRSGRVYTHHINDC